MQVLENAIARVEAAILRAQAKQEAAKTDHDRQVAIGKESGLGEALAIFKNELKVALAEAAEPAVEPEPEPQRAFDVQFSADGFDWAVPVLAPSAEDVQREFEARAGEFGWSMERLTITEVQSIAACAAATPRS